ncbi:MAG TPA: AAA family ATPase [Solirubrobacteraceae bacterium]|nr:AAA family ATPase [Solirubrobacteraceae bacterium]
MSFDDPRFAEPRFDDEVTVRYVRYANEQSGWAVLDAAAPDGSPVAMVGPLVHLEEGERVHVVGDWVDDSRYGRQVKVSEARPLPPQDPAALTGYLRRIKHIGARRAEELVARFGPEQVLDVIDSDPSHAFGQVGLRAARAQEAAESWQTLRVTRRLHLMLAPHGLAYLATRIHEHYGSAAHQILADDPYQLTSVFGVGFAIADRIARASGTPPDPAKRERAAVMHVLVEAERGGSTCLPAPVLLTEAGELVSAEVTETRIEALVTDGHAVREQEWVYRRATAELEAELAQRVDAMLDGEANPKLAEDRRRHVPAAAVADAPSELTDEQQAALEAALVHRLSVITGGPGTGKTASIKTIAATATERGARVMLVAPTGRAAVRMTEASGLRARTVHSALGWIPGEGPTHDAHDPLSCDLLIVDETSMANLELLVTLLRAVGEGTHVVLVGDADQLAPVGAGKPFAELVAADRVPVARLTHIFRQAADSMIVQGAHAIRGGQTPAFRATQGMRRDLFLIERPAAAAALEEIVSLVAERLPAHYGVDPVRDIQVFAPVYRGDLGIDALNRALRAALNPDGKPVRGGRLRIGDKLMMTGRNLHELGLMNGTVLRLLDEIAPGGAAGAGDDEDEDEAALLLGAEDAVFRLAPEDADRLQLAYACSVHRGQGIELPVSVIVAHPAAGAFFLRREMLYTAVTRARLATVIVGSAQVVARAARTPDTARRYGRLGERLARRAAPAPTQLP